MVLKRAALLIFISINSINLTYANKSVDPNSPLRPDTTVVAGDLSENEFFIVAEKDVPRLKTALQEAAKAKAVINEMTAEGQVVATKDSQLILQKLNAQCVAKTQPKVPLTLVQARRPSPKQSITLVHKQVLVNTLTKTKSVHTANPPFMQAKLRISDKPKPEKKITVPVIHSYAELVERDQSAKLKKSFNHKNKRLSINDLDNELSKHYFTAVKVKHQPKLIAQQGARGTANRLREALKKTPNQVSAKVKQGRADSSHIAFNEAGRYRIKNFEPAIVSRKKDEVKFK